MHEIFDFADPDFISNSFAVLRPRLIIHLEATIVELERERDYSAKTRRLTAERRRHDAAEFDVELASAREILAAGMAA